MAREPRGTVYAGIYHVTRRSAGPVDMFRDDVDRTDFCNRLDRAIGRFDWLCHAFCLMSTHYHLLLEVDEDALQPGMRVLNGCYAQQFNRRWARSGHLKGGPYGAARIETEEHLLGCVRYIARNPVEAGLCVHPADWYWSSYRGCAGYDDGFRFVTNEFILSLFHENRARAQRLLRAFVETA
ncbi:MAG TPA: transposase [Gaiellaceae bacterium]